jgi:hypothetical protein
MTGGHDPQLHDLEPLDPGQPQRGAGAAVTSAGSAAPQPPRAGLPPPAWSATCRDAVPYRLLMCGVLMVIGCVMPFGADLQLAGYKTMGGAFFLFVGIGMVWTWWAAIHDNRTNGASVKWLLLCLVPLVTQVMDLIAYDPVEALSAAKLAGGIAGNAETCASWGVMFHQLGLALSGMEDAAVAAARVENFFRCFGSGRVFVLLGAALAVVFFGMGRVGSSRPAEAQRPLRAAAAVERKRR